MRGSLLVLFCLVGGCKAGTEQPGADGKAIDPPLSLAVSSLELSAKEALEKRASDQRVADALEKRVKVAMEVVLIDPFSAHYRAMRSGRGGAICGQVNGRNRMGGYVGFKDFVVGRDGKSVWISQYSNGVETELYSGFAEAWVNACASKSQLARYKAATEVPDYYPDYEGDAAAQAAEDAARRM